MSSKAEQQQLQQAQAVLARQYLNHPDVTLIDIGSVMQQGQPTSQVAVRIHVRTQWQQQRPEERVRFPEQINGIPVVIMVGDYQVEADATNAEGEG